MAFTTAARAVRGLACHVLFTIHPKRKEQPHPKAPYAFLTRCPKVRRPNSPALRSTRCSSREQQTNLLIQQAKQQHAVKKA